MQSIKELNIDQKRKLVLEASKARALAYAPYSKFYVGAALLTADGQIYRGCNVENASYGLACCAERTATFKAVSEGANDIIAIAVSVPGEAAPCGACRQVLYEFNPHMLILFGDELGNLKGEALLSDLLPRAFGPESLIQI
jgi:cytidine deaminase